MRVLRVFVQILSIFVLAPHIEDYYSDNQCGKHCDAYDGFDNIGRFLASDMGSKVSMAKTNCRDEYRNTPSDKEKQEIEDRFLGYLPQKDNDKGNKK